MSISIKPGDYLWSQADFHKSTIHHNIYICTKGGQLTIAIPTGHHTYLIETKRSKKALQQLDHAVKNNQSIIDTVDVVEASPLAFAHCAKSRISLRVEEGEYVSMKEFLPLSEHGNVFYYSDLKVVEIATVENGMAMCLTIPSHLALPYYITAKNTLTSHTPDTSHSLLQTPEDLGILDIPENTRLLSQTETTLKALKAGMVNLGKNQLTCPAAESPPRRVHHSEEQGISACTPLSTASTC